MELNILNLYTPKNRGKDKHTKPLSLSGPNFSESGNYENLKPLKKDTVSFKSSQNIVKKSDFKGIDFATVEKYHIDISKFKSVDDLQDWAEEKIKTLTEKDYGGRQQETKIQRKALLKEWIDYVTKENEAYSPVVKLAILDAITKDLKPNTDTIPPVLNKGILADTISEAEDILNKNPKANININKLYQLKLNDAYFSSKKERKMHNDYTGWIIIPSKKRDPEHFSENVIKLKTLSHKNWCTKSYNADPYLSKGDFHIYLENGEPKLGVRFSGDEIQEIQGELNDSKIPQEYLSIAKKHMKKNFFSSYKLNKQTQNEFEDAYFLKEEINKIKKELGKDVIKNCDIEKILPYFGINVDKDKDGLFTISMYTNPCNVSFAELGINENKMFKNIKAITGNADFSDSQITNLGELRTIGENANFGNSKINNLGKLKSIGGNANFSRTKITDTGQLESIGGNANFNLSKINNITKLKSIGGNATFIGSKLKSLGNLETIGGGLVLSHSEICDTGKLKSIGSYLDLRDSKMAKQDFENVLISEQSIYQ